MKFSTILAFALITYTTLASAQSFRKDNADKAEQLANEFSKLTPDTPCSGIKLACIDKKFAQCVNGKFVLTACNGVLQCEVLPLVNSPGTSITCSTEADRKARLDDARKSAGGSKQPGAGNKQPDNGSKSPKNNNNLADIRKKNADEAEAQQEKFKTLDENSNCTDGENACVNDKFAQCLYGKFILTACVSGLKCAPLPLVLKEGTSIACTTEADRVARLDQARKNLK